MKIHRLLLILLLLLIAVFFIKTLQRPPAVRQAAVALSSVVPSEEPAPVMSYKIPDTAAPYKSKFEDEKDREKVRQGAGVALGLPTKAAYSPGIAVPSKEEVVEEIEIREKQRKDTEEKIAKKGRGPTASSPFTLGSTFTGTQYPSAAKDINRERPTVDGVRATDRRPVVLHH